MTGAALPKCPYCTFNIKGATPTVSCPTCRALHHEDCWQDNGGCAVALCASGPRPSAAADTGQGLPAAPPPAAASATHVAPPPPQAGWPPPPPAHGWPGPPGATPPYGPPPVTPGQTPPFGQQPPPPRRKFPWAWVLAGVAAVLLAGTASYAAVTLLDDEGGNGGGGRTTPSPTATAVDTPTPDETPTATPTETATPDDTPTPTPTADDTPGPTTDGPATVLRRHYERIDSGDYDGAYDLFSSAAKGRFIRDGWVGERQMEQAQFTNISVGEASVSGTTARVPATFSAQNTGGPVDDRCERTFSGTATMVKEDGEWRYDAPGDYERTPEDC